ncbi:glycosyltransferase family 4 protein [Leisingera sp. McT4-56]|uniref:glycosyltransferase family 4 protein n=1 Tax=Leisingera sp. McT4-56 TaxID=2881255 RepID=UPI001CF84264|nr:glycosyltransferase family 4 protein [Leisingera sp. McT4-56]MCB4457230.1 glycosyltransferase family 4 protein [Leisingera sp. McT4-56]
MSASSGSVLYLSPYFWPEEIGSAPYCRELAEHLSDQGYAVSALAFRPHYPSSAPFGDWAGGARDREALGQIAIERVPVNPRGSGGFKTRIGNDLRFLRRAVWHALCGTHRKTGAIIAYIPSVLALYGAKALKLRSGAPVIAVVHDIESGLAGSLGIASNPVVLKVMRLVERIGLNFADEVVVLTEGMKRELEEIGCRKPITVLPIWSQAAEEAPVDPAAPVRVMYSGNFGKKQNLDQLLPLLSHVSDTMPEVEILMRGGGSERSRIEAEAARRGIANARFLELAPAGEFMASLQSANVHLVPQALNVANYALPSKLFSIMSAGRPYVCIAEPGSPLDALARESGAGICVFPDDEARLCQEVAGLLSDPARQQRMGDAGRAFVQQHMNRGTIFSKYEAILRRLTGASRGAAHCGD